MRMMSRIRKTTKRSAKKARSSWPVAYRWAAVGTLIAYSAVGTKTLSAAQAQELQRPNSSNGSTAQTQGTLPTHRFDIPAGPLDGVLPVFERTTGYTVTLANERLRTISSKGVSGTFTTEQALEKILADTGLAYHFTSATNVSVDLKSVASSIEVTASVEALAASAPKFAQDPLDTPQTITAVPNAVMQQQGVTTLRDALRNVAGISLAAGEGGAQGDNLTIRGFTARNDLFIDGMRDFGSYYRDPFNTQEVEVLQGPAFGYVWPRFDRRSRQPGEQVARID